jgi:hypothetical protein
MRSRLLDLAVATVCVACLCAPMLPSVLAADSPEPSVVESGGAVDQKVLQAGVISNPLNGSFDTGASGKQSGSIQWDVYSSSPDGLKLLISTDRTPAMRDATHDVDVPDYGDTPSDWSVGANDRRFGFSVVGGIALSRFGDGTKWRGFDGKRPVEVARRGAAMPVTRTTIKLQSEFGAALASDSKATANIRATAVLNL